MTIQDPQFKVVGYIEETGLGGMLVVKDASLQIKGYYDPQANRTMDSSFRTIAHGNVLATLITPITPPRP